MATEPYDGYYASDPNFSPANCAFLYALVGPVATNHYHPLNETHTPPQPPELGFGYGGFGTGAFGGTLVQP